MDNNLSATFRIYACYWCGAVTNGVYAFAEIKGAKFHISLISSDVLCMINNNVYAYLCFAECASRGQLDLVEIV